ncbi:MAG: hypothetical protein K6G03_12245 [Lachnospiraceae bacterium]|nr:hypothetical protein [Lachnospiraceae bacterium]
MKKLISGLFTFNIAIILILLFFFKKTTDYYIKRVFMLDDPFLGVISLLVFVTVFIVIVFFEKPVRSFLEQNSKWLFPLSLIMLFVFEIVFVRSGFFYSDWDPAAVLAGAFSLFEGVPEDVGTSYFSAHPNNLMLVFIYYKVLLLLSPFFNGLSIWPVAYFQCLIFTLSGALVYSISKKLSGDLITAWITYMLYILAVGTSPWLIITYSDETGLIFPLIIFSIWLSSAAYGSDVPDKYKLMILYFVIGAVSYFGYSLKPQIIITTIAVLMTDIFGSLKDKRSPIHVLIHKILPCIAGMIALNLIISYLLIPSMQIELNKNEAFPMTHYFMMGLNSETDGVYADADGAFTNSFEDPVEKRGANIRVAFQRIKDYGLKGLAEHLAKKTMVNFGDGTFAYGIDGNFFAGKESGSFPVAEETLLTPLINRYILPDGSRFETASAFRHGLWLLLLMLCLLTGIVFTLRKYGLEMSSTGIMALQLSLLGLTMFELLFEAKARYLFIYLPFFILTSGIGLAFIKDRLLKLRK